MLFLGSLILGGYALLRAKDKEEVVETLSDKDVLAGTQQLLDLNKRLAVYSLDNLFRIEQITRGLRSLSNVTTAYDAQRWVYQLSAVYQSKLKHEHLILT